MALTITPTIDDILEMVTTFDEELRAAELRDLIVEGRKQLKEARRLNLRPLAQSVRRDLGEWEDELFDLCFPRISG